MGQPPDLTQHFKENFSIEALTLIRPLLRTAIILVCVFAFGTIGYLLVAGEGYGLLDAVYMTVITLTTVGYGETIDLSNNPAGRIFTIVLLLSGVGIYVYAFSNLTAFLVEGSLDRVFWRRKMRKMIEQLSQHHIVCGGGHTSHHIIEELLTTNRPFVVIEQTEERIKQLHELFEQEFPVVIGDATTDEVLRAAGIDKAASLAVCLNNDKDNLIVTISARMLNKDLRIVSQCIEEVVGEKIRKAGADALVCPSQIGGLRIVSEMVRPTAVSFLDTMLRDKELRLRIEEAAIAEDSDMNGKTIAHIKALNIQDLLIVALKGSNGEWTYNPGDDTQLGTDMRLVFMGTPDARVALEQITQNKLH